MNIIRPTLVLNKTTCLQNIELMFEKAKRNKVRFRPHFKTHQSHEIGRWFRNMGVTQITVSSVTMAKYFAADKWDNITIAFPFNALETDELNELASQITINIVLDNVAGAKRLSTSLKTSIGVFIKITTGFKRVGISHNSITEINQLIGEIEKNPLMNFKGFISHAGHTYEAKSKNEVQHIHFDSLFKLQKIKDLYSTRYPDLEISIGDTPGCSVSDNFQGADEIRPGNFVFYDLTQHSLGACKIDDIALRMHCPVISKQSYQNEIVIYGGAIHFSKDWIVNIDGKPLYGRIVIKHNEEKKLLPNTEYLSRLSQEHGVIRVSPDTFRKVEIGDIVEVIPAHACLTAHAMGRFVTTKGETITMMERF